MSEILSGKLVSKAIEIQLIEKVKKIKEKGVTPKLAILLVGNDYASVTYVNMKKKACEKIGLDCTVYSIDESITEKQVIALVKKLNKDESVNGIMIQHPMPYHINEQDVFNTITPEKDVDGLSDVSLLKLITNNKCFVPATALGILKLLEFFDVNVEGINALVVGRSRIVGKPLFHLLLNANATVTLAHSKTKNLTELSKNYDLICVAVGRPHFIKSSNFKKGAIVVDAGYNEGNVGDVLYDKTKHLGGYTPVPGGVGPMTIVSLIYQTVDACIKQNNLEL